MPVTMRGLRPMVHADVNGTDELFVADSGAFWSSLTRATAATFNLTLDPAPASFRPSGVGGDAGAWVTWVRTFSILGHTLPNVEFIVLPDDVGDDAAGLLGQNVFQIGDVEYDLAGGAIRIMNPHHCEKAPLAYWAQGTSQSVSAIDIEAATAAAPFIRSVAYLNGNRITVMFDTGASVSALTLAAARHAGVTPDTAGVVPAGDWMGIGHRKVPSWLAPFASFRIGDEEVRNATLRIGELGLPGIDMLVGADFFLSHHIYVANSQRRLYFTYNGGPVFNLTQSPAMQHSQPAGGGTALAGEQPVDAASFARRGAASNARHDYAGAIADLTRACELAPAESSYFYQRGMALWHNRQTDLAMADFDQAIRLKPDSVDALMERASLRVSRHDSAAAIAADLEAVDRALPRKDAARLRIGTLYVAAGQPRAAVAQYSKWIDSHLRADVHMADALNARCWARALAGDELDQALVDCNAALKMSPNTAAFLDSRGLVYLRQGNYDQAIADYDAAQRLQPKIAWSLYGRGVARVRKGMSAAGQADMDAASGLAPQIAERARAYGIVP